MIQEIFYKEGVKCNVNNVVGISRSGRKTGVCAGNIEGSSGSTSSRKSQNIGRREKMKQLPSEELKQEEELAELEAKVAELEAEVAELEEQQAKVARLEARYAMLKEAVREAWKLRQLQRLQVIRKVQEMGFFIR